MNKMCDVCVTKNCDTCLYNVELNKPKYYFYSYYIGNDSGNLLRSDVSEQIHPLKIIKNLNNRLTGNNSYTLITFQEITKEEYNIFHAL